MNMSILARPSMLTTKFSFKNQTWINSREYNFTTYATDWKYFGNVLQGSLLHTWWQAVWCQAVHTQGNVVSQATWCEVIRTPPPPFWTGVQFSRKFLPQRKNTVWDSLMDLKSDLPDWNLVLEGPGLTFSLNSLIACVFIIFVAPSPAIDYNSVATCVVAAICLTAQFDVEILTSLGSLCYS